MNGYTHSTGFVSKLRTGKPKRSELLYGQAPQMASSKVLTSPEEKALGYHILRPPPEENQ